MPQRRKPSMQSNPFYEDAGLFKNTISPVAVELVPQMHRNMRQDLVVRAFVQAEREIEVVFAGRRAKQVAPLVARLDSIIAQGRRWANGRNIQLDVDRLRLSLRVEGAWRQRFKRDETGWQTRSYNLMAARWTLIDPKGNIDVFGEEGAVTVQK